MVSMIRRRALVYTLNGVYLTLLCLGFPVLVWKFLFRGRYRQGVWSKLTGRLPQPIAATSNPVVQNTVAQNAVAPPRIWCHAVSLGEVQVLAQFASQFRTAQVPRTLVITTGTDTGFDVAKKRFPNEPVHFAPLDFSWSVAAAMDRIAPEALVLTELELWPNWISEAARREIPVAVINARMSAESFRGYQRIGMWTRSLFESLTLVACQTESDRDAFVRLGVAPSAAAVTGSLKFDSADPARERHRTEKLSALIGLCPSQTVILAGSTSDPEEDVVLRAFAQVASHDPTVRLILVPRHPERCDEIARRLASSPFSFIRRSRMHHPGDGSGTRIVLVDVVGELGAWWPMADIGFVGGSLGRRGGQNMIEPAASSVATCFGPNTRNFRDVVRMLIHRGGAEVVHSEAELASFFQRMLTEPHTRRELAENARQVVLAQRGATGRTVTLVNDLILRRSRTNAFGGLESRERTETTCQSTHPVASTTTIRRAA